MGRYLYPFLLSNETNWAMGLLYTLTLGGAGGERTNWGIAVAAGAREARGRHQAADLREASCGRLVPGVGAATVAVPGT
jgi:hypothetical protein